MRASKIQRDGRLPEFRPPCEILLCPPPAETYLGAGTFVPTGADTSEFGTLRTKLRPPCPAACPVACAFGQPARVTCHWQVP